MGFTVPSPPPRVVKIDGKTYTILGCGVPPRLRGLPKAPTCDYCGNGISTHLGNCEGCGAPKAKSFTSGASRFLFAQPTISGTNISAAHIDYPTGNPGTR